MLIHTLLLDKRMDKMMNNIHWKGDASPTEPIGILAWVREKTEAKVLEKTDLSEIDQYLKYTEQDKASRTKDLKKDIRKNIKHYTDLLDGMNDHSSYGIPEISEYLLFHPSSTFPKRFWEAIINDLNISL
jgi:hypothetical protein